MVQLCPEQKNNLENTWAVYSYKELWSISVLNMKCISGFHVIINGFSLNTKIPMATFSAWVGFLNCLCYLAIMFIFMDMCGCAWAILKHAQLNKMELSLKQILEISVNTVLIIRISLYFKVNGMLRYLKSQSTFYRLCYWWAWILAIIILVHWIKL